MIYTNSDGGARGNPGRGAVGVIVRDENTILTKYSSKIGDHVTNNIAEYEALIAALKIAKKYGEEITCILDSELVVKQLLGEYRVKNPHLIDLFREVQRLIEKYKKVKFVHVDRWDKFQQLADELVNIELDKR